MGTSRFMAIVKSLAALSILLFIAGYGCGGDSGSKPLPAESLSVTITSPSWNVTITQGESIDFQTKVSGGVSPYTFLWDFDSGANNSTVENPGLVAFEASGNYTVKLTVTDSTAATASASVEIIVQDKSSDIPPGVRYTSPAYGAKDVPADTHVQVVFSVGVDLSTVTTSTFTVGIGGDAVSGTVTSSNSVATFIPSSPFQLNTLYTARLTTGVKDLAGNAILPSDYVWSFSTIGYTLKATISSPPGNVTILEGQPVNFQGSVTGGRTPYTYKWNFTRDMPSSTEQNPGDVTFSTRGTYPVVLRVTDADGYISSDVVNVTVYSTTAGDWSKITAGGGHTLALKSDGTLWAWGYNAYGQLGNNSHVNRYAPVQVGSDDSWASLATGFSHSLALKNDGTLWAWGQNDNGQLGDGTTVERKIPVQVDAENIWAAVAAGYGYSLALKNDGTLWAWGRNDHGQLGDGTWADKNTPVQVGPFSNWSKVTAGYYHNLAIKKDGTLWAWGHNDHGQIGNGLTVDSNVPLQMDSENNWIAAAAGNGHSLALKKDGTLLAWGDNDHGQLGDDTDDDSFTPVQAGTDSNWSAVTAGYDYSLAIKKDGTLWAWGYNAVGQLGDGSIEDQQTPVQVGSEITWDLVAAGYYHTGAIKKGGTLWMWGYNISGQLGDNTMNNSDTPVQVK